MLDKLYAHIDQGNLRKVQTLFSHLFNTACESKKIGEKVEMENISFLLGLLHDNGKASIDFQEKITKNSNKRVDHSSLGGLFVLKIYKDIQSEFKYASSDYILELKEILMADKSLISELSDYTNILIYTIMSHHGQYDMVRKNEDMAYVFTSLERMKKIKKLEYKFGTSDSESFDIDEFYIDTQKFFEAKKININRIFCKGFLEYAKVLEKLKRTAFDYSQEKREEAVYFYKAMLIRLLVSILKSADIKDTINAFGEIIIDEDENNLKKVIKNFEKNVDEKYSSFGEALGELNILRNKISEDILKRSKEDRNGIYKLDLPTGAGKTLLSLRYGINQMNYQNKERFFYVTSFLSVLEQNASEMKKVLNNDKYVLEHHSNVVDDEEEASIDDKEDSIEITRKRFLLDDWTSPVVLTTMVQFYNSLFKGKSANLTRFKSFINSVIILDEWQSIPTEFLYLTNLVLNFMKIVMRANFVLSTATQPTNDYDALCHKLFYGDLFGKNKDIIEHKNYDFSAFERAKLKIYGDIRKMYGIEDVKDLVLENSDKSNLIILNTKSVVKKLYDLLEEDYEEGDLYYLTTNLTASDRLKKIGEIKKRLKDGEKICLISTQLIEAGVDVDFDMVIRSLSGMDSIIQSMGRCNREGKKEEAYTYLIKLDNTEEKTSLLKGVDKRKSACQSAFESYEDDFDIKDLTKEYFEKLYANLEKDKFSPVLELLAENKDKCDALKKTKEFVMLKGYLVSTELGMPIDLFQSFKEAYKDFELIEENQKAAVVNYAETKELIERIWQLEQEFLKNYNPKDLREIKIILKKLNRHTVSVREKDLGFCDKILDGKVYILPQEYYDEKFGVNFENPGGFFM